MNKLLNALKPLTKEQAQMRVNALMRMIPKTKLNEFIASIEPQSEKDKETQSSASYRYSLATRSFIGKYRGKFHRLTIGAQVLREDATKRYSKRKKLFWAPIELCIEGDTHHYLDKINFAQMNGWRLDPDNRWEGVWNVTFSDWHRVERNYHPGSYSSGLITATEMIALYPELKYMAYDGSLELFSYIERFRKEPRVEMFGKLGLSNLITDSRFLRIKDKKFLNYIRDHVGDIKRLRLNYVDIRKCFTQNLNVELYYKVYRDSGYFVRGALEMLKEVPPAELTAYLVKVQQPSEEIGQTLQRLRDYLTMAQRVGVEEKLPPNLEKSHAHVQNLVNKLEYKENKKDYDTYARISKEYEKLTEGLVSENFRIMPIPTVSDVKTEGETLKHCVYTNKYHKHVIDGTALLLSARSADGLPIETIEIDLKMPRIMQCRGLKNLSSEHHDAIVNTVEQWVETTLKPYQERKKKKVKKISLPKASMRLQVAV